MCRERPYKKQYSLKEYGHICMGIYGHVWACVGMYGHAYISDALFQTLPQVLRAKTQGAAGIDVQWP